MVLPLLGLIAAGVGQALVPTYQNYAADKRAEGMGQRFRDAGIDFTDPNATPESLYQRGMMAGIGEDIEFGVGQAFGQRQSDQRLAQSDLNSRRSAGVAMRGQDLAQARWLAEREAEAQAAQRKREEMQWAIDNMDAPTYSTWAPWAYDHWKEKYLENNQNLNSAGMTDRQILQDQAAADAEYFKNLATVNEFDPQAIAMRNQARIEDIDMALNVLDPSLFEVGAATQTMNALKIAQINEQMGVARMDYFYNVMGRTDAPGESDLEMLNMIFPTVTSDWNPFNDAAQAAVTRRALLRLKRQYQ